ncbi:hypothetical protein HYU22_04825 [Candidatus Woesearchaeota archaeon]|nr:hypothetical protein [Candidatus Woesearchaeota archaeon]
MTEIYLIGTQHYDINGPGQLEEALLEIEPDIILVEGPEAKTTAKQRYYGFLKNELDKQKINRELAEEFLKKQERVGYEANVSIKYAEKRSVECGHLNDDLPVPSRQQDRATAREEVRDIIKYGITLENFFDHLNRRQARIQDDWAYLRRVVGTLQEKIDTDYNISTSKKNVGPRDSQMENVLRTVVSTNESKRIVTVTGFIHVLDDPKNRNLYGRVRDLNPKRKFLY